MAQDIPRTDQPYPPEWMGDLSPEHLAGRNVGLQGTHPEKTGRTAYDVKGAHRQLQHFADDELKRIPIMPTGARLEQAATYLDLHALDRGEFTATGNMVAGPSQWIIPKTEVDYELWNRLLELRSEAA
jgi:hypothetical protein